MFNSYHYRNDTDTTLVLYNRNPKIICPIWLAAYVGTWIPEVTPTGLTCMPHIGHVPGAWIPEVTHTVLDCMPNVSHIPYKWRALGQ